MPFFVHYLEAWLVYQYRYTCVYSTMAVAFINSNMSAFGSDLDRKVKETAAACEAAWADVETGPALRVWRIERFHVVPWPEEMYGSFHVGDCYIVLKRLFDHPPHSYSIHFWLGDESSIDERGTAAYKTVELDTKLGGTPVQYRELQGSESDVFKSYFSGLTYLPGGVESGFRTVHPDEYNNWQPIITMVGTVKIVDEGSVIQIIESKDSSSNDRFRATCMGFNLRSSRPDVRIVTSHEW
jgi:hypothetical protein